MHQIGFLGPISAADIAIRLEALRAGMRDLAPLMGPQLETIIRAMAAKP